MGRRKESVTIYLEPGEPARWARLKDATKVPTAVRIREALTRELERLEREHAEELAKLPPS
jgi:hypothetical protein